MEDLGSAAAGMSEAYRVPGQVLLHLDEGVLLPEVPADQLAVPRDDPRLVVALLRGRPRLEGLVEDPGAAERAGADHHRLAAGLGHHAPRLGHGADVAVARP